MDTAGPGEITQLLEAVARGDLRSRDQLMSRVYVELKALARRRVPPSASDTMPPTALVHEAYVKMFGRADVSWENRHHFFWAAARAMHDVLIERARAKSAKKRGGGQSLSALPTDVPDDDSGSEFDAEELIALSEALSRLETLHPDIHEIVMLRYFGGLTREEVVKSTGLAGGTVWRHWCFAKAWLRTELEGRGGQHLRLDD